MFKDSSSTNLSDSVITRTMALDNSETLESSPARALGAAGTGASAGPGGSINSQNKTLKKEELELIAKQLKRKLSRASITAKQSLSPTSLRRSSSSMSKTSPHKGGRNRHNSEVSLNESVLLSSSPSQLYSPNGKSPTQMKTPAAVYLSSSPLKNIAGEAEGDGDGEGQEMGVDSPTRTKGDKKRVEGGSEPQMVLQKIGRVPQTPPKNSGATLKPSPTLSKSAQRTPTLLKRQLAPGSPTNANSLLKTPTQGRQTTNGSYNDEEGADLLMYLATSPSPAKPFPGTTPRSSGEVIHHAPGIHLTPSTSAANGLSRSMNPNASNSSMPPPVPLTPKRHLVPNAKTPQSRLTPSANLFNTLSNSSVLPSSGLTLTPAGFNMSDYVNFFTPSPGGANINSGSAGLGKNILKTPDFNSVGTPNKHLVDGKMINFDKVGLFGSGTSNETVTKDES